MTYILALLIDVICDLQKLAGNQVKNLKKF